MIGMRINNIKELLGKKIIFEFATGKFAVANIKDLTNDSKVLVLWENIPESLDEKFTSINIDQFNCWTSFRGLNLV